jgi:hypothetical protein
LPFWFCPLSFELFRIHHILHWHSGLGFVAGSPFSFFDSASLYPLLYQPASCLLPRTFLFTWMLTDPFPRFSRRCRYD